MGANSFSEQFKRKAYYSPSNPSQSGTKCAKIALRYLLHLCSVRLLSMQMWPIAYSIVSIFDVRCLPEIQNTCLRTFSNDHGSSDSSNGGEECYYH